MCFKKLLYIFCGDEHEDKGASSARRRAQISIKCSRVISWARERERDESRSLCVPETDGNVGGSCCRIFTWLRARRRLPPFCLPAAPSHSRSPRAVFLCSARVIYFFLFDSHQSSAVCVGSGVRLKNSCLCWRNIFCGASAAGCQKARAGAKMNLASYFLIKPSSHVDANRNVSDAGMKTRGRGVPLSARGLFFQQLCTQNAN